MQAEQHRPQQDPHISLLDVARAAIARMMLRLFEVVMRFVRPVVHAMKVMLLRALFLAVVLAAAYLLYLYAVTAVR